MAVTNALVVEFQAMASPCSLHFRKPDSPELRMAAEAAIAEVRRIEHKFSRYRADSVVSRINAAAGGAAVPIDPETAGLLDFAGQLWHLSGGLFDITSGVLRKAWDFRQSKLPSEACLQALKTLVGWSHFTFDREQACLGQPGMEIDFGGFGKEYAVDRAAAVLVEHGITEALVNLGGDIHALAPSSSLEPAGTPWILDIQHPRPPKDQPQARIAQLRLVSGGLATSGDYERFLVHQGVRYCHVLDPRSGWPVRAYQSVSVVAATSTAAGALSTIAMLKGPEAQAWLEEQGVSYLMVDAQGCLLSNAAHEPAPVSNTAQPPTELAPQVFSTVTRIHPTARPQEQHS